MPLEDRYEVIDAAHGEGGYGRVSKRRDKALERLVAVKQLRLLADTSAKARFEREAKALARMTHPNIPAIYDVQFANGQMYIVFEFVEGQTLREVIHAGTPPPPLDKVRRWFTQAAAALEHAHSKGIVHRDVKPDNIIISPDHENATLVDFGIALTGDDARSLTKEGYAIGTLAYMSPEQAQGQDIDARSDLYSLGITLYEALSGHLPHPGGYQSLADANEIIPPTFDEIVKACLVQERNARMQSAQEFIKQIRAAFRSDVPLSSLLTEGRLHEVAAALRQMSAEEFGAKPRGQKLLLINRLKDLIRTDRPEVRTGTIEVIALMVTRARFEVERDYRPIVNAALQWGFQKQFGPNWQGDEDIRDQLVEASKSANEAAHKVIASEGISLFSGMDFGSLPRWYTHDLRLLLAALLANPHCGTEAEALANLYDNLNEATH